MHLIILTIMLTATLPAYAGPAAKLSRQLGIPGAPFVTQGIPMGAGSGPAQ